MQFLTLNNGIKMPILGFGTYQIPPEETKQAVLDAIDVGYRLIDTAQFYKNEKEVGEAIKECGVDREELFITTKVWINNYGYENCLDSIKESLEKLGLDYIDLVLIHQPFSDYYGAYSALEDLYEAGIIKAIGVSNFYPDRLTDICLFNRRIIPQINQVEVNPFNGQYAAQANMEKNGVQMQAWAPFGQGRHGMFENETLKKIGEKNGGRTPAQVILRWLVERSIVVLAKSTHKERMAENIDIFDFALDEEDMMEIMNLDNGETLFFNHQNPEVVERFEDIS
ncbi:2,5-diketo-D-gluconate reductase A [Methanobrevibacter gottschalkii]|uniref:2,5-diketo-D-gluconate reductase A n=1 Tax=Methanobrevibacter gottschalkii TaxID=190974 RepID=A0A1H7GYF5_9EURY|nr:aldo/keto reductase [Methanobrevibacter gottschalkii]SEK43111.1 2,5-diketo-D-gluconate reductase A [Methanobrevibacter gottschalkii]